MGKKYSEWDHEVADYMDTDHNFSTLSRSGEFRAGSRWGSEVSGGRGIMEASGKAKFRDTYGGNQSDPRWKSAAYQYEGRAMSAVTHSAAFLPNEDQPKHHNN